MKVHTDGSLVIACWRERRTVVTHNRGGPCLTSSFMKFCKVYLADQCNSVQENWSRIIHQCIERKAVEIADALQTSERTNKSILWSKWKHVDSVDHWFTLVFDKMVLRWWLFLTVKESTVMTNRHSSRELNLSVSSSIRDQRYSQDWSIKKLDKSISLFLLVNYSNICSYRKSDARWWAMFSKGRIDQSIRNGIHCDNRLVRPLMASTLIVEKNRTKDTIRKIPSWSYIHLRKWILSRKISELVTTNNRSLDSYDAATQKERKHSRTARCKAQALFKRWLMLAKIKHAYR
jgi:hypothetical protein